MKISEMSTEQGFDVMAKLAPYISEIVQDEEIKSVAEQYKSQNGIGDSMDRLFPLMLAKHRKALYGMVSAVTGKTEETIKKQPMQTTKEDFSQTLCDDVFDFFILFMRMALRA